MFDNIPAEVIGWTGTAACLVIIAIGIWALWESFIKDEDGES